MATLQDTSWKMTLANVQIRIYIQNILASALLGIRPSQKSTDVPSKQPQNQVLPSDCASTIQQVLSVERAHAFRPAVPATASQFTRQTYPRPRAPPAQQPRHRRGPASTPPRNPHPRLPHPRRRHTQNARRRRCRTRGSRATARRERPVPAWRSRSGPTTARAAGPEYTHACECFTSSYD